MASSSHNQFNCLVRVPNDPHRVKQIYVPCVSYIVVLSTEHLPNFIERFTQIIATLVDLSGEQSTDGRPDDALATLSHLALYQPMGAASRKHFSKVLALQRAKVLRCANRLAEAESEYRRGFTLAHELGETRGPASVQLDLARKMNELVEVLNWQGRNDAAGKVDFSFSFSFLFLFAFVHIHLRLVSG